MNGQPYEPESLAGYTPAMLSAARGVWATRGEQALAESSSYRLRLAGLPVRMRLSRCFADAVYPGVSEDEAQREYYANLRKYGVPWSLILLLAKIAWDLLWYWFTHRKESA